MRGDLIDRPTARRGTASSLSRIRAATLRPVARAFCLNRRSVVSGSLTVMPFMIAHQRNSERMAMPPRGACGAGLSAEGRIRERSRQEGGCRQDGEGGEGRTGKKEGAAAEVQAQRAKDVVNFRLGR